MRSTLEIMKGGDLIYEDGGWRPAPTGVYRACFAFLEPIGRWPTRYPSGEVITVPRHTQTARGLLLTTSTAAPIGRAGDPDALRPAGAGAALRTPLRSLSAGRSAPCPRAPEERRGGGGMDDRGRCPTARTARPAAPVVRGTDVYGITAVHDAWRRRRAGQRPVSTERARSDLPQPSTRRAFLDHLGERARPRGASGPGRVPTLRTCPEDPIRRPLRRPGGAAPAHGGVRLADAGERRRWPGPTTPSSWRST